MPALELLRYLDGLGPIIVSYPRLRGRDGAGVEVLSEQVAPSQNRLLERDEFGENRFGIPKQGLI